ncbi:MAG: tetratricopeptide repeat protein [Acidobacteria bacterium]|nr:tetratricopeptide repeat protein [Acidobacteriota bacterium]
MRRLAVILASTAAVVAVVLLVQHLEREREYRRLLAEGEAALADGRSAVAIELFSGALALRPSSMPAYYRRGEAYRAQGFDEQAVRDLREAARLAPTAAQPLIALGAVYDQRSEPAAAAEWYGRAAMRLKDEDPALLYAWALALYRTGAPAAAREPLQRALARNDGMAEAHYLLGLVYRDAGDLAQAAASLEHAIRLAPPLVAAREELADLYRERGQPADEMAQLHALAALDAQVDRRLALGLARARAGEFDEALATLDAAAAEAPNDSRVWLAIGRVRLGQAEHGHDRHAVTAALATLERALAGSARRSEGLALFGRALFLSGDTSGAERILAEAVATSPVDPEAFAFLADAAERNGHAGVARRALVDLDALDGDTVPAAVRVARARRIGALSLEAGDPRHALAALTEAANASPSDPDTLGLLARARWLTGDADGARAALREALALDAADPALRTLSRTIR